MNRIIRYIILWIFVLSLHNVSYCQDYPMVHYTMADGLPSNIVYDIYRDSKGYIWVSTDKGISRYNGIRFETFTTFDGLPDNEIFFFQEDYYGRLWLATFNGNLCFYQNGVFHTAQNTSYLKMDFKTSFIKNIFLEKDSSVSFIFSEQMKFINISKNSTHTHHIDSSNGISSIVYIKKLHDTLYALTFGNKTYYLNNQNKIIKSVTVDDTLATNYLWIQNNDFYFNDRIIKNDRDSIILRLKPGFTTTYDLHRFFLADSNIYLCTNNGIFVNDTDRILPGVNISSINKDIKGNYWFGSLGNGIYSKYSKGTQLYRSHYNEKVKYCCIIKNQLFYITYDNMVYTFKDGKSTLLFNYFSFKHQRYQKGVEPAYYIDSNFKYYCFYYNEYITIDNILAKKLNIKRYKSSNSFNDIKAIYLDGPNLYQQNRINIFKLNLDNLKPEDDYNNKTTSITDIRIKLRIYSSGRDLHNNIWYSTINNIFKIVHDTPVIQKQFKDIAFKSFILYKNYMIGYTHENQMIVCKDFDTNIKIDSIPFQNCIWNKFYPIDSNHLLISTNNLYRLVTLNNNKYENKATVTAIENSYIPLLAESIISDTTNCYFFKDGDITSISINSILQRPAPPEITFTSLKTNNKTFAIGTGLEIPYADAKNMRILFSAISFGSKFVLYQYSFTKNDRENWTDLNGEEISLVNLGYGTYHIKLRAKTISSIFCQPIEFTLLVLRPWWAMWWFILLCMLFSVTVIGLLVRHRIRKAIQKREKEHNDEIKFMKSEYKTMNALMNPHFIFNTLNNVQGLVNRNDKLAANEYLRVFADLIRQNMHNITKELIPLQKEIDLVNNYLTLEKLRFKEHLNYCINIDDEVDITAISIPPLLIQPLVENSIKHGILPMESVDGKIEINIYEKDSNLYIEVKDNGIGFTASNKNKIAGHESYGLENIRKRIEQLNIIQDMSISFTITEIPGDNENNRWTVVSIVIPE